MLARKFFTLGYRDGQRAIRAVDLDKLTRQIHSILKSSLPVYLEKVSVDNRGIFQIQTSFNADKPSFTETNISKPFPGKPLFADIKQALETTLRIGKKTPKVFFVQASHYNGVYKMDFGIRGI